MERLERLGRHIDDAVSAKLPSRVVLQGRYVRLEPMVAETHYRCLYKNFLKTPHLFDLMIEPELTTL